MMAMLMSEMTLFIWNLFLLVKLFQKISVACKISLENGEKGEGKVCVYLRRKHFKVFFSTKTSGIVVVLFWAKTKALTGTGDTDCP